SLLAGFTEGFPGEWTSFPPHKHDDKVEVYVYYGLGDGFGVQIVEDEGGADSYIVRDGDAVVILRGYHPNVASPGSRICYVWVLCQTLGEKNMRVEVKPGFERFQVGGHLQVKRP
ncbi:MAG: 5-deoxy-glucuronate isomerase, partial [Thermofilaceae archaeon]